MYEHCVNYIAHVCIYTHISSIMWHVWYMFVRINKWPGASECTSYWGGEFGR